MHKISPQYSHQIYVSNEYRNALMIHITDVCCICNSFFCKTTFIIHFMRDDCICHATIFVFISYKYCYSWWLINSNIYLTYELKMHHIWLDVPINRPFWCALWCYALKTSFIIMEVNIKLLLHFFFSIKGKIFKESCKIIMKHK